MFSEPTTGMTVGFKQNGTGLLFLLVWSQMQTYCTDKYCYGGLELGPLTNIGYMGTAKTPTLMILISQSWGGVDEFVSNGNLNPTPVEKNGYKTQTTCGFAVASGNYTAECYRPFTLKDAWPQDFNLSIGSTVEIGFAVGECYPTPGIHLATDMSTYVLSLTNQTYTAVQTTTSTTTSSSATSSLTPTSFTNSSTGTTTVKTTTVSTSSSIASTTTSTTTSTKRAPVRPVSLYAEVQQYGPYLPLAAIIIAAVHFVRRKAWTGRSPW